MTTFQKGKHRWKVVVVLIFSRKWKLSRVEQKSFLGNRLLSLLLTVCQKDRTLAISWKGSLFWRGSCVRVWRENETRDCNDCHRAFAEISCDADTDITCYNTSTEPKEPRRWHKKIFPFWKKNGPVRKLGLILEYLYISWPGSGAPVLVRLCDRRFLQTKLQNVINESMISAVARYRPSFIAFWYGTGFMKMTGSAVGREMVISPGGNCWATRPVPFHVGLSL